MTDPMTPDSREANLPAWARETLRALRQAVSQGRTEAATLRGELDPATNTVADYSPVPGIAAYPSIPLRPHTKVAFLLDDDAEPSRVEVSVARPGDPTSREGCVVVRGVSRRTSGSLVVRPVSGNTIEVTVDSNDGGGHR